MSVNTSKRVAVVTGAGRGIGRAEAIELATQGFSVVVNDVDVVGAAASVVEEIRRAGGEAVANGDDVGDWEGAGTLIGTAVEEFGGLHVLVNNAGILRDRMFANMSCEEWDDVIHVHLRGTFAPSRHAAEYWRNQSKAGHETRASIINTSSSTGLYGQVGQSNYGAAKAGIANLTVILAEELARYGVRVNAIAPAALTRMTEALRERTDEEKRAMDPANIAPLVAWLGSDDAAGITGRVFNIKGSVLSVAEPWVAGPEIDNGGRWDPASLSASVPALVEKSRGRSGMDGRTIG